MSKFKDLCVFSPFVAATKHVEDTFCLLTKIETLRHLFFKVIFIAKETSVKNEKTTQGIGDSIYKLFTWPKN